MRFTSPFATSLIFIACLGSGIPCAARALADNAPPAKTDQKAPADEGGIATGTVLSDCDGTLISPPDRHPGDYAGASVAVRADTLLIGAPGVDLPNTSDNRGAVYFYYRTLNTWWYGQRVSSAMAGDGLGGSVAMEGDHAVTGARYADSVAENAGLAYTWHRNSATDWDPDPALTAWDGAAGDEYGAAVAIGDDWVAISAPFKTMGANNILAGKVYLYRLIGQSWVWQRDFQMPTPQAGDTLGTSLTMRGNMLAAGATGADGGGHFDAGSVLVAEANPFSSNPFFATYASAVVTANDAHAQDHFGASVALSDQFLYVGAPDADVAGYPDTGAVYVFQRTGTAAYQQVAKITWLGASHLGRTVVVDGQNIVVRDGNGNILRYRQPDPLVSLNPQFLNLRTRPADASATYGQALSISGNDLAIGDLQRSFSPTGGEGAVQMLAAPANDLCANAIAISHNIFSGCTLNANNDGSASCATSATSSDVWYSLTGTPNNAGPWVLKLASNYDSAMSVHTGGCPGTSNNEVACNDDGAGHLDARINLDVVSGQTYLIRVSGFLNEAGAFQLIARRNDCPADIAPQPLGNRAVNIDDLLMVIGAWGSCPSLDCPADIVGSTQAVDIDDLLAVIAAWGPCPN